MALTSAARDPSREWLNYFRFSHKGSESPHYPLWAGLWDDHDSDPEPLFGHGSQAVAFAPPPRIETVAVEFVWRFPSGLQGCVWDGGAHV